MKFIAKLFGLKLHNEQESKLLKTQNKILQEAIVEINNRCADLERENALLRKRIADKTAADSTMEKLIKELSLMELEYMEPVGDA